MSLIPKLNITTRTLLANFTYLSILEIVGILLPLVTYPYVIKTVGPENYGIVVFCQAIIAYIIIIINFGYNVSATRKISENRSDISKIREIYSSVIYQKLIIFIICVIITYLVLLLVDYTHYYIIFAFLGLCIQEVFFPTWLFQGLERMKFITIITFLAKCTYLVLIFIFIRNQSDYIYIPLLYSFGGVLTSILSILLLKIKFDIYFVPVSILTMKHDFIESLPFFTSRLSSVIMERSNVLAIGAYFTYDMVAAYDLCTKIVSILKTPFSLLAQVIYPNIAKSKNTSIVNKIYPKVIYFGLLICVLVGIFSKNIIVLLSDTTMLHSIPILRLMVLYVPIVGISYLFGASVLVVKGYAKDYNLSVIYSVILYIILLFFFILISKVNLYTMTVAFILPEFFIAIYRTIIIKNNNLLMK